MVGLWVLLGVAVIALASAVWPGWVRIFRPRPSRIRGAPAHSVPTWPARAVSAGVLAVLATIGVGVLWPDDATRGWVTAGASLVLWIALGIWFIAAVVAAHDRDASDRMRMGVDRPRTVRGYGFEYTSVFGAFLAVAISGLLFATSLVDQRSPDLAPTATADAVDEVFKDFNTLHAQLPVLTAAPEAGDVIAAWWYAPVSAETESPYVVWHQSATSTGESAATVLRDADLVLRVPSMICTPVGIVVIETAETVTVGVAVAEAAPAPTPDAGATPGPDGIPTPGPSATAVPSDRCTPLGMLNSQWYPVALAAPLGDRRVVNVNGRYLARYFPPVDLTG